MMIVQIDEGKLCGTEGKSILTGETYYSFLRIPYGKPPTGDRRFLKPSNNSKLKLVLFNIHGGGFFMGTGVRKMCSPDYLMEHDVIVISIDYRLHILGFLNLGLPECPGNAGMKDQVLALKWVRKNVKHFGGDPQNVTIIGGSAGGASVYLHLLSPLSKGLFQKAVPLCGNAYSPWAFTYNPIEGAFLVAQKLGFSRSKDDREGMLRLFKEESYGNIAEASRNGPGRSITATPFKPSMNVIKEDAFLPDFLVQLVKNVNPVPVISGVNEREGMMFALINLTAKTTTELIERMVSSVKYSFRIEPSKLPIVIEKAKQLYCGEGTEPEEITEALVNLTTDIICYYFEEAHDSLVKSSNSTYLYNFAYAADSSATHGDDYNTLFYGTMWCPDGKQISEADEKVIRSFSTLLSNFAKTGNPNPDPTKIIWRPSTENDRCHLRIDMNLEMAKGPMMGDRLQRLKSTLGSTLKPYNFSDSAN